MIVDNFKLIKDFIEFKEGEFYFIQIMQRRKENPELSGYNRLIKSYYVDNIAYLEAREEEIKTLCDTFNARAYIRLTRRSYEAVAIKNMDLIVDYLYNKNLKPVKSSYESACGHSRVADKNWVIDIDTKDKSIITKYKEEINLCDSEYDNNIMLEVPTVNGMHLITRPFNTKQLEPMRVKYPVDIHTNNPTLLYYK